MPLCSNEVIQQFISDQRYTTYNLSGLQESMISRTHETRGGSVTDSPGEGSQALVALESPGGLIKTDCWAPCLEFLIQQIWEEVGELKHF